VNARVIVKLVNRDQVLTFGVTAAAHTPEGKLSITLWEPVNESITRSVEIKPDGWEWYEWQYDDPIIPVDPRGRIANPTLLAGEAVATNSPNPHNNPRLGPDTTYGLLSGQDQEKPH
jgi:hypothetical protein